MSGVVWEALEARVDVRSLRPRLREDVEVHDSLAWGNDYAMVANPRDLVYYRVAPWEAKLVRSMDGTRTVGELVVAHLEGSGDLEVAGVAELVRQLEAENFLDHDFVDANTALDRALHPVSPARAKAVEFVKTLSIETPRAEQLVRFLHRWFFRIFFWRPVQLLSALVAVAGLVAFVVVEQSGDFEFDPTPGVAAFVLLFALDAAIVFLHELGHALVLVHQGRRVKSAGFRIYFGSPAFFVDSSDGLMLDRRERIAQAFAGPYAELVVAGLVSFVLLAGPGVSGGDLLYRFLVLNYFTIFLNLIPLLELDGYWILSDAIQVPDLRPRSLTFVRRELWTKLRRRERLSLQQVGLATYGVVGVVFTVAVLVAAFFFWRGIFGGFIAGMWDGGVVTRVLLVVLIVFLAGPLLRGAVALGRSAVTVVRRQWRHLHFRGQRRWRVEAARLLDASGAFGDIPVEILNDLAGRAELQVLGTGVAVVRQGEPADAFYVVRSGTLEVVEEHGADDERLLRRLARGDGFGEVALLEGARRNATVRAAVRSQVFRFDKGTFDRLLADRSSTRAFGPTLSELQELAALPPFAHLAGDELRALRERGRWLRLEAGSEPVRQGEPGDAFYVVGSGRFEVVRNGGLTGEVGPGEHFGELALLLDAPRAATVRALTPVRVFRLPRSGFNELVVAAFRRDVDRPNLALDRTWDH